MIFTKEDLKQVILKRSKYQTVDVTDRPDFTPKKRPMEKILKAIRNTVAGENKVGEAAHGILDLLPIPNQPIAKLVKYITEGETEKAEAELGKLLTFRNIVAVLLFILVVTGVITISDVRDLIGLIGAL